MVIVSGSTLAVYRQFSTFWVVFGLWKAKHYLTGGVTITSIHRSITGNVRTMTMGLVDIFLLSHVLSVKWKHGLLVSPLVLLCEACLIGDSSMFSSMPSSGWRTSLWESSCCNWWTKGWFWRNDTFCENGLVNDRLGPHSIIIKERNNCWNSKNNICVFKNWVKYKTETKGNPPEPWHSFQLKTDRFNFLSKNDFFFLEKYAIFKY